MTKNISRIVLALLMMVVAIPASAAFKDFKIDLTAYNDASSLLTADEVSNNANFEFGIAVADDGTISRVDKADASATAVISGKYHNDHGCTGVKLVVPVDGAVKIGVGNCTYSGHTVKVKDASSAEVASFAVGTGCWSRNKSDELVTYGYYKGAATTLTIESSSYTPFISIEAATEVPTEYTATYSWGSIAGLGILPAGAKVNAGESITIPANMTMFVEGKTLTADEYLGFLGRMFLELGKLYRKHRLVMHLHLSAYRNPNSHLFARLGADCGCDCIGHSVDGGDLIRILDAIESVFRANAMAAQRHNQELTCHTEEDLPLISGDRSRLEQGQ